MLCCRPPVSDSASSQPVDAGRASLLQAICSFDKKKLSRAGERKIKKKKKHEDVVDTAGTAPGGGGSGDYMSDLKNKLRQRRMGISGGAGKTGGSNGGGAASEADTGRRSQNPLDQLSKLIPPPAPKPRLDLSSSHDDSWHDG